MPLAHPADSMKKYCPTHWPVNMNYAFIVKIQWEENEFKYRVRVMVFNPHFQQYFSYIYNSGGQFYWWRKPEYPVNTTNMS
jgi:hypothetical protein